METVTVVEEEMQTTNNNIYTNTSDLYVAEEINSFFFYEVSIIIYLQAVRYWYKAVFFLNLFVTSGSPPESICRLSVSEWFFRDFPTPQNYQHPTLLTKTTN